MKIKKKLLIIPLLSFLCLNKVYAECSQQEIDEFKKIEDQFTVTYELDNSSKLYTIYLKNPQIGKYGYEISGISENIVPTIENDTVILKNVVSGNYNFAVYNNNENCKEPLKKIDLNLLKYNKYSESKACDGLEDFYLCQETYDEEIDEETFEERIEMYKETQKEEEIKQKEINKQEKIQEVSNIFTFIKDNINLILIGLFIALVLAVIITIIVKKSIKRRRLE